MTAMREGATTPRRALARAAARAARWLGEPADLSEAELRDLVAASSIDREERRLIDEVLAAGVRYVREVMVPRTEVLFLDAKLTLDQAVRAVRHQPHSRFPVIAGDVDDVIGFVHLRDLLFAPDPGATVDSLAREVRRVPATRRILAALSEMRREGHHLAVVVDEYGGTAGIVTLEDLIEELVGEIQDEYDASPGDVDGEVDGLLNLSDLAERTGLALPPGPYETLGGYLMAALGALPGVGDEVHVAGWRLTVAAMDGRRVAKVAVAPPAGAPSAAGAPPAGAMRPAASSPAGAPPAAAPPAVPPPAAQPPAVPPPAAQPPAVPPQRASA